MLDAIDVVLRHIKRQKNRSFGGVQLLLIGDLLQLPPVVKEEEWNYLNPYYSGIYFFNAIEKWFEIKPELFLQNPLNFKNKVLALKISNTSYHKQPCET